MQKTIKKVGALEKKHDQTLNLLDCKKEEDVQGQERMNKQATPAPVKDMLTPEEKSLVDLISSAIIKKTFKSEG